MLYLFDEFRLDTDRRELWNAAGQVTVEPQVFDLLAFLVRNRDQVVDRDRILDAIWGGRAVSPSALSTRINAARRAIGDSGEAQRLIRTLPRKGLRFVGTVREEAAPGHEVPPASSADQPAHRRPAIAVLPFVNMSDDAAQEYFADGMVEEILTALSHMRDLLVIGRNTSFAYKGRTVDARQVGRELGVRYVLDGSVRKVANQVRITGQLVDAETGAQLWAERFEGCLENVFDLQDRVAERVVGAIAPRLGQAEIERARRKPTESLDAYDFYLRAMADVHRWTPEGNAAALENLRAAISRDPDFAPAYGLAARCYSQRKSCGWMADRAQETAEAGRLARQAVALGQDDAVALCMGGIALAYVVGEVEDGARLIDRALALNANLAWAWVFGSWVKIWLGEAEAAVERGARAVELSPNDPEVLFFMQTATAYSHFLAGRYDDAASWAHAATRQRPDFFISVCAAAASDALAGNLDAARKGVERLRTLVPGLRVADMPEMFPFQRPEDAARWAAALRKAGLPNS